METDWDMENLQGLHENRNHLQPYPQVVPLYWFSVGDIVNAGILNGIVTFYSDYTSLALHKSDML